MWMSMVLLAAYFVWALRIWRLAPPIISEQELASEEFCYCYTTTPLRRLVIMFGSCALFAFVLWLVSFAINYLIWSEVFARFLPSDSAIRYVVLIGVVVLIAALGQLPISRRLLTEVCVFFQRCQFFPMLPSLKEESLIGQIANLPVGILPKEIQDALSKDPALSKDIHVQGIYEQYRRLEVLYRELQALAKQRRGVIRRFYFGREWEMIRNQFKAIDRQMHSNSTDADAALAQKIHTCLYYCYGLLTRVIMETTASVEESRALFQYYGFDVNVAD
jgi:hypothetical protein